MQPASAQQRNVNCPHCRVTVRNGSGIAFTCPACKGQVLADGSAGSPPAPVQLSKRTSLRELQRKIATNRVLAWIIALALPLVGITALAIVGIPWFLLVIPAGMLFVVGLSIASAVADFIGTAFMILVGARIAVVLVVGILLFVLTGNAWAFLVSVVLLFVLTEVVLGRNVLKDLAELL